MKTRSGFVSNSSSSSFIIMGDTKNKLLVPTLPNDEILTIPDDFGGKQKFDWEVEWSSDFQSKMNYCIVQAMQDEKVMEKVKSALEEFLNVDEIKINLTNDWDKMNNKNWAYIDHQSSISEGEAQIVFISKENIINFIFNPESKILMGNDNGEGFYDELDKHELFL